MHRPICVLILVLLASARPSICGADPQGPLRRSVGQLIVATGADWSSSKGSLRCFERSRAGRWQPSGPSIPVLFGANGMAWGRGVRTAEGTAKVERDKRAPAGVFSIGRVFGYDAAAPAGSVVDYVQVGDRDAWVDDPQNPLYNRFVRIPPDQPLPPWFESQHMRHGDFAYRWLVEIHHNADPPVPGFGSAIFFHIRRGPDRPTAGCTTMAAGDLEALIRWLRPDHNPHYVLLPREEYLARWKAWGLPDPSTLEEPPRLPGR